MRCAANAFRPGRRHNLEFHLCARNKLVRIACAQNLCRRPCFIAQVNLNERFRHIVRSDVTAFNRGERALLIMGQAAEMPGRRSGRSHPGLQLRRDWFVRTHRLPGASGRGQFGNHRISRQNLPGSTLQRCLTDGTPQLNGEPSRAHSLTSYQPDVIFPSASRSFLRCCQVTGYRYDNDNSSGREPCPRQRRRRMDRASEK